MSYSQYWKRRNSVRFVTHNESEIEAELLVEETLNLHSDPHEVAPTNSQTEDTP